jgi:uncharacterized cupin superfamily protein
MFLVDEMPATGRIEVGAGNASLSPSPIHPNWILEGNPLARNKVLSCSSDGNASTWLWDCSAGRFNWFYDIDETVYIIEGSVMIKDADHGVRHVNAGDTIYFPAGSTAEWTVPRYVRKVAFLRGPLPRPLQIARRGYRSLKRLIGWHREVAGNRP